MTVKSFRARVQFRRAEDGGRTKPVYSGYRPMLNFEPWQSYQFNDGALTFIGREWCTPGETCEADIILAAPDYVPVELRPGVHFQMNEGSRIVADAEVIAVD